MSPRPKKLGAKDLPRYVSRNKVKETYYYRWTNPLTSKATGLGKDKARAIAAGTFLNEQVQKQLDANWMKSIVDRATTPSSSIKFHAWLDDYYKICVDRELAYNTLKSLRSRIKKIKGGIPDCPLPTISVSDIASLLDNISDEGKKRLAQACRSTLVDAFNEAHRSGHWPESRSNPADVTRNIKVKVETGRITLAQFMEILEHAKAAREPWEYLSMLLAFLAGQHIAEVAKMKFSDVIDGYLVINRKKTGAQIAIPLDIKQHALPYTLGDVIAMCRQTGVVSKYMLHHIKAYSNAPVGSAVHSVNINRAFKRNRDAIEATWKKAPGFGGIRSLSGREYETAGTINTQDLYGHTNAKTSKIYTHPRELGHVVEFKPGEKTT